MTRLLAPGAQAALLFCTWLALSMRLDPLFLAMGAGSAVGVTALTHDLLRQALRGMPPPRELPRGALRAARFAVWLLARIALASAQIAWIVLHPRLPVRPGVLHIRTGLRSPLARAIVANSITLIPGTLTVEAEADHYVVHVLVPEAAQDLIERRLQDKVGAIFLEAPEGPVEPRWEEGP